MTHTTTEGQDLIDVTIQNYGDLETGLFKLLADNSAIDINTTIQSGDELKINNEELGETQVIQYYQNRDFVVNNADEQQLNTVLGAFNNAFNNAFDNITL